MKPCIWGFVEILQGIGPFPRQPGWTQRPSHLVSVSLFDYIGNPGEFGTICDWKVNVVPGFALDKQCPVLSQS